MDPPPPYSPLPDQGAARVGPYSQQQHQLPSRPPLPPRTSLQPTAAAAASQSPCYPDPRSASQTSLVPVGDPTKRTLLVIYIHGFMGNETSFQSFPAHLHNLLCVTMDPLGYLVHTKVYPKFKTRHNILVATENFSQWLSQFENDNTDVVLLGHSMGGLLSADVALLQDYNGRRRHRLLGTISFDTPFLGMHPGVISAGLGSIFRPAPKSPAEESASLYQGGEASSQSTTSLHTVNSATSQIDEFYSKKPQRNFTVTVPKKEGTWDSTFHFINKYHSRLTQATGHYLMSHLEFGGCLADPIGLKNRYLAIRALEDGEPNPNGGFDRIRFVNYYTSSTDRIKGAVPPPPAATPTTQAFEGDLDIPAVELYPDEKADTAYAKELQGLRLGEPSGSGHARSASVSSYNTASSYGDMKHIPADPMADEDDYHGDPVAVHIVESDDPPVADGRMPEGLFVNEKVPFDDEKLPDYGEGSSSGVTRQITGESALLEKMSEEMMLAPIPPPPEEPKTFDYSQIPDPVVRKVAEKEAARVRKRYEKAVRDHAKLVRDRERMSEKLEKRKGKEVVREEKRCEKEERDRLKEKEKAERDRLKEREKAERDRLKELRDLERERDKRERDREREERDKAKEMRDWDRERENQDREQERQAREKLRELKEWEKEKERQKREKELEEKRGKEKDENSHEKQELERLRKEQERMDAEYRRMNGIPEPPPPAPLSPRQAPPSSASSSRSHLPLPQHNYSQPITPVSTPASPQPKQKKKREHRFCMLPSDKNDKCWVKVEMEGVDEVGAHCGLFFVGEVYERLVGDVAARIEEWVGEETSRRVAERTG